MIKPRLWKYKSGIKAGKLRPKAKQYLSYKLKEYYKRRRIIKEQVREEIEKHKYRRQSQVLSAYYKSEKFFDWRVSILNSKKLNTKDYLKQVLKNRWEKWASGNRKESWNFLIEGYEDEYIDKGEASHFKKQNVVVWEKR